MASTASHAAALRAVTVVLPHRGIDNLDKVNKIVASALGRVGCPACFSGFDIRFRPGDLVVNPKTLEVNAIG
jgi:hypothetical protein